jgi:hypothetical protein
MMRRAGVLRASVLFAAFAVVLLLAGLEYGQVHAQEDPPPGTVPPPLYLPLVAMGELFPPPGVYDAIPVESRRGDNRPAALHGDLNLALRSYTSTVAALALIDLGGETDPQAPQLADIFHPAQLPPVAAVYQVYDWDWNCGPHGCRGAPLTTWEVTLVEVTATHGLTLHIPMRGAEIYNGGYRAMVLYAEESRLTLAYTRHDGAEVGYVVHFEDIRVDPGLLALYNQLDAAGRNQLPALRNGERVGYVHGATFKVAIRDTGSFMDPRSRKDWWVGFLMLNGQW